MLAHVLPRWGTYLFRLSSHSREQKDGTHRLLRGLPGYLILFAPHAFVPERQNSLSQLLSLSVFCDISMHFTATCHIPPTPNFL